MKSGSMMPLLAHISELRKRLIKIFVMIAISTAGGLIISPKILNHLKTVPPASEISWNVFSPWDGIRMYMNIALIFAIAVTLPYILFELWQFVKAGLSKQEQKKWRSATSHIRFYALPPDYPSLTMWYFP